LGVAVGRATYSSPRRENSCKVELKPCSGLGVVWLSAAEPPKQNEPQRGRAQMWLARVVKRAREERQSGAEERESGRER
jgi:hypothetical protein